MVELKHELFIAVNGNDNNSGTIDSPLLTLERARDIIREKQWEDQIIVYLRGGRYFRRSPFVLCGDDYSTIKPSVTYRAYRDESVFIDGGIVIDPEDVKKVTDEKILNRIIDEKAREHIYEIDLKKYQIQYGEYGNRGFRRPYIPAPNELFIDGEEQTIARFPNEGDPPIPLTEVVDKGSVPYEQEFDMRPAVFRYHFARPNLWTEASNAYVAGFFNWAWADDTIKIGKIDPQSRTITTTLPHLFGFKAQPHTSWYVVNLLEEIDMPGEYFIDPALEKVFFYPPKDIKNSCIQISVMEEPMVILEDISNVCFEDITFENARGSGIYIEGGSSNRIKNCTLRNLGMVAVQIGQGATILPDGRHTAHGIYAQGVPEVKLASRMIGNWNEMMYQFAACNNNGGTNHGIINCEIYNTGTGGILLGGGDRKSLTPAGNYVENCRIYRVNRLDKTYKSGVTLWGVGNRISHCELYDMPGNAIIIHGNDHIIEYNRIHDVVKCVADAGAIYIGRDVSEVGNVIRYNFIYNLVSSLDQSGYGICAVYFDDYAVYNEIYGNYFYNIVQKGHPFFSTIFWNKGGETSVGNNVFIDCLPGLNPNITSNAYEGMHNDDIVALRCSIKDPDDMRGVDITSEIYKEKYPYLYDAYVNNRAQGTKYWNNVVTVDYYDEYVDAEHMNFNLKEDSNAVKYLKADHVTDLVHGLYDETVRFEAVDFDEIGLTETTGPGNRPLTDKETVKRLFCNQEHINIVYLGGSITQGAGASDAANCWADRMTRYFQELVPDHRVRGFNAGMGGTGSKLGLYRLYDDVIAKDPDVVFVEFAVNDAEQDPKETERYVEGIVRNLLNQPKPPVILFVYTTTNRLNACDAVYEQIASYYKIPSVNLQEHIKALVADGLDFAEFLTDGTHPNDLGHLIYFNHIKAHLGRMKKPCRRAKPLNYDFYRYMGKKVMSGDAVQTGKWETDGITQYSSEPGATLIFHFDGPFVGVINRIGRRFGVCEISIDGAIVKELDNYYDLECQSVMWFNENNLSEGRHTLEIKVLGEKNEFSLGHLIGIDYIYVKK